MNLKELRLVRSALCGGAPMRIRDAVWWGSSGALLFCYCAWRLFVTRGWSDYLGLLAGLASMAYWFHRYKADRPLALTLERAKAIVQRERDQLGLKD